MVADAEPLTVYGDSAYGTGALLDTFEQTGVIARCKTQPPRAPGGRFPKSEFQIDLDAGTVTCPAGHTVRLRPLKSGQIARFGALCAGCPLAKQCTGSRKGRTIALGEHERQLAGARARQSDPAWKTDYSQTRPKVERKIAHLMRRKHGGRRARVRGSTEGRRRLLAPRRCREPRPPRRAWAHPRTRRMGAQHQLSAPQPGAGRPEACLSGHQPAHNSSPAANGLRQPAEHALTGLTWASPPRRPRAQPAVNRAYSTPAS